MVAELVGVVLSEGWFEGGFQPEGIVDVSEPAMPEFLEACGLTGPLGVRVEGPGVGEGTSHVLGQPFLVIGRGEGADLRLDHPEVGRRHAYVQVIAGRAFCVDLESRTGTHWEGGPGPMGWLPRGQALGIGPWKVGPWDGWPDGGGESESGGGAYPTSRSFAQPGATASALESLDPGMENATWRVGRALILLGRSRGCKVRLQDADSSKFHCSLVSTPSGTWVVDLLSRSGTFVNGERVRSARLREGDELRAGRHRFRLRGHHAEAKPPARRGLPGGATSGVEMASAGADPDRGVTQVFAGPPAQADPNLMPVLKEFGEMQQQMAEQFQQALMMMFRMFSGMHQDQMALIRDELARIRQLAEKQEAIEAELARRPPLPGAGPVLRLLAAEPPLGVDTTPDPLSVRLAPGGSEPEATGSRAQPLRTAEPRDPLEIHAALFRRLDSIQEERKGRWQKLLGSLMGRDSGGSLP